MKTCDERPIIEVLKDIRVISKCKDEDGKDYGASIEYEGEEYIIGHDGNSLEYIELLVRDQEGNLLDPVDPRLDITGKDKSFTEAVELALRNHAFTDED
jgi:hypothetical protein